MRADGRVSLLAAADERVGARLLRTALATSRGRGPTVDFLDAQQDWAIDVVLDGRPRARPGGATCVRGEVGPMRPYIP